jgi:hypothetical protein
MFSKTTIALSAALVLGGAAMVSASEWRDGDNNLIPAASAQHRTQSLMAPGAFAGPAFATRRPAGRVAAGSDWDRCVWWTGVACVH